MTASDGKVHTESEQRICPVYVKKTAVHETFKCRIEQFESLVDTYGEDDFLCSEEVPTEMYPGAFWELHVTPGNVDSGHVDVSLSLTGVLGDYGGFSFDTLNPSLYLVSEANDKIDSFLIEYDGSEYGHNHHMEFYGPIEIKHCRVMDALQADGSLVVAVDVEFLRPDSDLPDYEDQLRWVAKLSEFCDDPTTADCWIKREEFQIGGETLHAHKHLLMACSTAFRTMFTSSASEESKSGVIEIEDFEHPEPMRALLQYCNSGRLDAEIMDGEWSEETFKLACKYSVDDLKALLERHFIDETLCVENVVDLAVLADSHNAGQLKAACIQLIAREVKTVFKSAEWEELKEADSTLRAELAEGAATLLAGPATPLLQATTKIQGPEEEQEAGERWETYKGTMHTESGRKISQQYMRRSLVHLSIKLRIEEFESLMSSCTEDDCLCSEEVSSEWAPGVVWKLEVHPNIGTHRNISVCLDKTISMGDDRETLQDFHHLYLYLHTGQIDSLERDDEFDTDPIEIEHDRVKMALQADGSLEVGACVEFIAPGGNSLHGYEDQQRWVAKLSEYFADPTTSDCCIKINGETLPAHKLLLMACSRVLYEKFTDPTAEESISGVVKIMDSNEPAPMRAVLHYCYQGQLDAETMDGEWSEETFKLACRFRIDDLKALLEKRYINTLSVENVVAMAIRADTYFIDKLKQACIKLIASEGGTVFDSADWKELEEANAKLAAELAAGTTLPANE